MTFRLSSSTPEHAGARPAIIPTQQTLQGPSRTDPAPQSVEESTVEKPTATSSTAGQDIVADDPAPKSAAVEVRLDAQPSKLEELVEETQRKLDQKNVVLEKIGRFRGVFEIIKSGVDAASDVSSIHR